MIHPEATFLSSCEPDQLRASKVQWGDRCRIDIPFLKGRIQKEEKSNGSQTSPKPSQTNSIYWILKFEMNPFDSVSCFPGDRDGSVTPVALWHTPHLFSSAGLHSHGSTGVPSLQLCQGRVLWVVPPLRLPAEVI